MGENMIKVIHILGAAGSGTSTLGKIIAEEYGYQWLDVDEYYWEKSEIPFTVARPETLRVKLIEKDIKKHEKVVISGSVCNWGNELIKYFDLVIKVDTPTSIRIERLKKREQERFGKRVLEGGDMYQNHQAFLNWASLYDDGDIDVRSNKLQLKWLENIKVPVLFMDGTLNKKQYLEILNPILLKQ